LRAELTQTKQTLENESVQLNAIIEAQKAMIDKWLFTDAQQNRVPT
jgi:hypothetical protein